MRQLLATREDDYRLYGVHVSEFRSDVKGVLGLRATCKELAEHNAKEYMSDAIFCIAENLQESRDPEDMQRTMTGITSYIAEAQEFGWGVGEELHEALEEMREFY